MSLIAWVPNKSTAPFTADEVIEHANTLPTNYEMSFLRSSLGKQLIDTLISQLNANRLPSPDLNGLADRYNRHSPSAGYNKSVIADFVSEAKRSGMV